MELIDHFGNRYSSLLEMCDTYGIKPTTFLCKVYQGKSVEEILGKPKISRKPKICKDHLGNMYSSVNNMCDKYKIPTKTYKDRVKHGWRLEDALTKPVMTRARGIFDHLGNRHKTVEDMCKHWGVKLGTYYSRIKSGYTVERALTDKRRNKQENIYDHLGTKYESVKTMCKAYGICRTTYIARRNKGMSLQEALTKECDISKRRSNALKRTYK